MSLNSVVNNLVRAAAGIPADISDTDLDQHVAALLAKEAKEREMKWSEIGLGGLLGNSAGRDSPDPNAPKPNKRFLASVIRTVDTHNSSVVRQQLEAAETARSNAGLGESSRSAASRMFGGAMRDAAAGGSKGRARARDRGRPYDSRGRDKLDRRDVEDRRWHDKRQASRERRTRYDVAEEEEMYNTGADTLPERKEKKDWIKRKEERDKRKRADREDEESARRRRDLYGDDDEIEERGGSRRSRSPRRRRETSRDIDEREAPRDEREAPRRSTHIHDDSGKKDRRRRHRHEEEDGAEDRKDRRSDRASTRDKGEGSSRHRRRREDTVSEDEYRKHSRRRDKDADREAKDGDARHRDRSRSRSPRRPKETNGDKHFVRSPAHSKSKRKDPSPPPRKRIATVSPSPGPPPPDLAPPPPDSPPPPPPPPGASKMDKYFKADYDPRLDLGEVPRDGHVPEVGWDNMLAILKERGKKPRNRSPGLYDDPLEIPKVYLRRTPSPTAKEIEKAERRAKRAARGFDDDFETEAERAKRKAERKKEKEERARVTQLGPGDGGGLFDVSYVKKGGVREWDMGK